MSKVARHARRAVEMSQSSQYRILTELAVAYIFFFLTTTIKHFFYYYSNSAISAKVRMCVILRLVGTVLGLPLSLYNTCSTSGQRSCSCELLWRANCVRNGPVARSQVVRALERFARTGAGTSLCSEHFVSVDGRPTTRSFYQRTTS